VNIKVTVEFFFFQPFTQSVAQEFASLAEALATGTPVDPGFPAINLSYVNFHLQPENVLDTHPTGKPFGTVAVDRSRDQYSVGDKVNVSFWGANLRNDYLQGSSFLEVQRAVGSNWVTALDDGNWETKIHWARANHTMSLITLEWNIAPDTIAGEYRMFHRGFAKPDPISSKLEAYSGASKSFNVVTP